MKSKGLIIGALPLPFEGPWVVLDRELDWEIQGLQEGIRVDRDDEKVRAVIEKELEIEGRVNVLAVGCVHD